MTDLRADLLRELGRIVRRCLQKDVEDRYQTAKDIRSDLQALRAEVDSGDVGRERAAGTRASGAVTGFAWSRDGRQFAAWSTEVDSDVVLITDDSKTGPGEKR